MTSPATSTTPTVDRYGFPIETCRRCGGSGRYSFNRLDGSTCYGCAGTGTDYTKAGGQAAAAWLNAVKASRRPTPETLVAGDVVSRDSDALAASACRWQTVASVTVTPLRCGSSLAGTDEADRVYYYKRAVTFTDGEVWIAGGIRLRRRTPLLDVAPFLAAAGIR